MDNRYVYMCVYVCIYKNWVYMSNSLNFSSEIWYDIRVICSFLAVLEFKLSTQCLARQALYCLSHASSPFALVVFEIGYCSFPRPAWTTTFLLYTCHTGTCHHAQLFLMRWESHELLPGLAWNHDPSNLSLPSV
jgi:hypothetical protein